MKREDFPMLDNNLIYFDNGATTFKPKPVLEAICEYYTDYTANAHRGDYDISLKVDNKYEGARELARKLINANSTSEIVFTSGTTDSLNKIIFGFFKNVLKKSDEILLTKSEHASNILPWFELVDELGLKVNYIELNENLEVTMDSVKKAITSNTKVISLAHITNVAGDVRPIKEITKLAREKGIYVLIDGAQSVSHLPVDVIDLDVDFLTFSAHKMLGPTGVGVIYGKEELLEKTHPIIFGGGMNASFNYDGTREYKFLPFRLEAGTPNIAGVIGMGAAIEYLLDIGMKNIHEYEYELKKYFISKLETIPEIIIYNKNTKSGIVTFNYEDIFSQDLAIYLNKFNVCVRAGNHCARMLKDELGIKNTCRASFYFYNTKEEIDNVIDLLKKPNIKDEII